ncbi:MAG: TrmH family RNA methyltransferase [Woeseiaceae bacterium]
MKNPKINIGLINPKSPENVSSVLRSAGNFGVAHVFYTGSRYSRAVSLNPDTPQMSRKVSEYIPLVGVKDLIDIVPSDMKIVCVEFAENALPLPNYQHPGNAFYIFGPEDNSIPQDIINQADDVVYVPTKGCMNLSATVNVLLYDRLAKLFSATASTHDFKNNDLIRQNRDVNNSLKVPS